MDRGGRGGALVACRRGATRLVAACSASAVVARRRATPGVPASCCTTRPPSSRPAAGTGTSARLAAAGVLPVDNFAFNFDTNGFTALPGFQTYLDNFAFRPDTNGFFTPPGFWTYFDDFAFCFDLDFLAPLLHVLLPAHAVLR
mmetsp:Transcript_6520/g.20979  ORF Transcript_6520/g.20979 Transcript_6520/m.20979 type:complete len:143 (+) Transcript_6520:246-674(+)